MTKTDWIVWLRDQQSSIDEIIAKAGLQFFEKFQKNDNFWYDLNCCQDESYNLVRGKDLCYDRVATPLSYSLWYQARRINTFLSHFIDQLIRMGDEEQLDVFDLGAGTGAIQMCLGLVYHKLKSENKPVPVLRIFNVDTSPFMLAYNRNILWPEFFKVYPGAREIHVEYHVNSWNNRKEIEVNSPWLSASYLFDMSDDKEQIKDDFIKIIDTLKPSQLLLLTSDQPGKRLLLQSVSNELKIKGWVIEFGDTSALIFDGPLLKVNALRVHYSRLAGNHSLGRSSSWKDSSFVSAKISKVQSSFNYSSFSKEAKKIDLYNPPFKVRVDISLSNDQRKASLNSNRPAVIIGPAGCGKSVVITERVINILKAHSGSTPVSILLTTFNKELLKKLLEWLQSLLEAHKFKFKTVLDNDFNGFPRGAATINSENGLFQIRLLHFDMLAKFIGNIPLRYFNVTQHEGILARCIREVIAERNVSLGEYETVLNTDFLLEEYHRVIYGLQCKIKDGVEYYQKISRRGRGNNPSLTRGIKREIVWSCLEKYAKEIYSKDIQSFTTRRQLLIHKIKGGQISQKFDYVIVDEFQDCTNADFEIFWGLLKNNNNLIIAGDIAQAIHIGRSANIPRDDNMANREFFRLKGSYRLPQRISECILNLSKKIKESGGNAEGIEEISPYKGSPPGARPIIVYGQTDEEIAIKIKAVFNNYKIFGISEITILEKDNQLRSLLVQQGIEAETDTILRLKGLEKGCVVWSTMTTIEFEKEAKEFVYTILTRTSCILIIAFTDVVCESFKGIFSLLNQERLIFWDADSEAKFKSSIIPYVEINGEDEEYVLPII